MADQLGASDGTHPNLNLTAEEKRVYGQLLKEADPDGFSAVSGDVAVKFFERTKLAPDVLGQIWQIADTENRGFLTPSGFAVVLRLVGHAQAGRQPSAQLATSPAPIPRFDARPGAASQAPVSAQSTGMPTSPSQSGGPPTRVPALAPEKAAEYAGLFEKSGADNGMLSGVAAKQIFERARLPNDVLGRIWNLSDTQGRGFLDPTEFVIAMHLLASYKSGQMRGIPDTLPPGLYDAAARRPPPRMAGMQRPGSGSMPAVTAIPPQFSGSANARAQSPIARHQMSTPLSTQSTGEPWAVNAADKARFDSIFATVDVQGRGLISGDQAVEFFGNSRLPEEVLAQIWDLADINSDGVLNRDEFAVAMYLIRQQRGTKDGRGILPAQLPPSLVPPSMRAQQVTSSQTTAPAFDAAPVTKPRSAADDLFGLDVMSQDAPATQQVAQSTGGTDAGPFANPKSPSMPPVTGSPQQASTFKPFIPSSTFGQSLMPQPGGSPVPGQTRAAPVSKAEDDLLGDADHEQSAKLTNDSAELGNLSNQVGSLSRQMTDLQGTRAQAEQELSQGATQKKAFQDRLAQLRTAYEQEARAVKSLQEQLSTSRGDTKKVQQEMAMIEGTHADLQTQRQQLSAALQTDQQENASLKERIRQMNVEIEQIKPQLEKLKSDARQQKGLVAINKKQLATNEAERDRLKAEMAAAQQEMSEASREVEETSRQIDSSHKDLEQARSERAAAPKSPPPVAAAAAVVSPTPSTSSNPFFRQQTSDVATPPVDSERGIQDTTQERNNAFDNIFGPSFGVATAAPATSFGHETPPAQHDVPTPTDTPTPVVVEPPPPAPANQIKSSALPFRQPLSREGSVSSSIKVAPPASRLSPSDTPRAETPDTSTASPASHRPDADPFGSSAPDEEQESVRQTLPRANTDEEIEGIPGAFPTGEPSQLTPKAEESHGSKGLAAGLGAAGIAAGAGVAAAAVHGHDKAEEKTELAPSGTEATPANNFDDFFGGPAHQRTPSEQAADFDSAVASMDKGNASNGVPPKKEDPEFPAIQELDDADDSSSDEDERPKGFDDDFNAPSKATEPEAATSAKEPETASAVPDSLQPPRPQLESSSTASSLPGFEQQTSPPTYADANPADENPTHFPQEYKGLLPEREDPTSPTLDAAESSTQPLASVASPPPTYGPEVGQPRRASQTEAAAAPPTKSSPFDFDSAFANMGAAPVADDSDSDYGDEPGTGKKEAMEFDPSFDTPSPSTRAAAATASVVPPMSTHDAVTAPPVTNGTSPKAVSSSQPQSNNFFGFNDSAPSSSTNQQQQQPPASTVPSGISHDWDALFAPLNSSGPTTSASAAGTGLTKTTTNASMQSTEIAPGTAATTVAVPIDNDSPSRVTPTPAANTASSTVPSAAPAGLAAAPVAQQEPGKLQRPQPGRALSAGTEHDDPILKQLVGMGFSRSDSLAALEKYDYNIDKAADYLMFRS